jgi:alanine racemase
MYRGAVRVATRLVEVRDGRGPAGYGGFVVERHGVVLCGYANGLRKGPCWVNGQRRRIIEVGMQSAYVEVGREDRVGDEVVLLGEGVSIEDVAEAWGTVPHEVLLALTASGQRQYA